MSVAEVAVDTDTRLSRVRDALNGILAQAGLSVPTIDAAFSDTVEKRTDPFDSSITEVFTWLGPRGDLLGTVQLHETGRVFAEHDVVQNHPGKPGWFVASVSVWGDDATVRGELSLIPLPE